MVVVVCSHVHNRLKKKKINAGRHSLSFLSVASPLSRPVLARKHNSTPHCSLHRDFIHEWTDTHYPTNSLPLTRHFLARSCCQRIAKNVIFKISPKVRLEAFPKKIAPLCPALTLPRILNPVQMRSRGLKRAPDKLPALFESRQPFLACVSNVSL